MSFWFEFFKSQLWPSLPYPQENWTGRVVIVSGGSSGLGLEAARHFVRLGAKKVIISGRSVEKGETAKLDIEKSTKKTGIVEVWPLDLQSSQSVKEFAKRAESLQRIDALVESAGLATYEFKLVEGNERTVATNVIGTFLLLLLLIPIMKKSAAVFNTRPNCVVVSSDAHFLTSFKERTAPKILDHLNTEGSDMQDRYLVSKLLEVLVVRELCNELPKGFPLAINAVNPGMCQTHLDDHEGMIFAILLKIFGRTAEMGSRTLVHGASAGESSHGLYLSDCLPKDPSPFVCSEEGAQVQARLWVELREKLDTISPGIFAKL